MRMLVPPFNQYIEKGKKTLPVLQGLSVDNG